MTSTITITRTLFLSAVSLIILETKLPNAIASIQDLIEAEQGVRKVEPGTTSY